MERAFLPRVPRNGASHSSGTGKTKRGSRPRAWSMRPWDALMYSSEVQQHPHVSVDRCGRLRTVRGSLCCSGTDQVRFGL
jgi:hypothetical protein